MVKVKKKKYPLKVCSIFNYTNLENGGLIMSFNFTKTVVFTVKEKMPFNIPYDEEEFEKFSHALLVDKNAEWLGGYLFNIKNIVSIKRV